MMHSLSMTMTATRSLSTTMTATRSLSTTMTATRSLSTTMTATRSLSLTMTAMAVAACGQQDSLASLPVADAGFDRVVLVGSAAQLDGSASLDPDGKSLTYVWRLDSRPPGSDAAVVRATAVDPTLFVDVAGYYLVSLVVSNGQRQSEPDRVAVRAVGELPNLPPVADARCVPQPCTVEDCQPYTAGCWVGHGSDGNLSARQSSDPNGDQLTYLWEQVLPADCASECPDLDAADCPTVSVPVTPEESATDPAVWEYTASTELGKLTFKLTVSDGELSDTACATIDAINFAPRAIVVQQPKIWNLTTSGPTFEINGSPSSDSDPPDASLSYWWSHLPAGVSVSYDPSPSDASPQVTVSGISSSTELTFVLTVDDGNAVNSTSSCDVDALATCTVSCCGLVVNVTP